MASTVWIVRYLWLIPALPILAAGIGALLKQGQRKTAAAMARPFEATSNLGNDYFKGPHRSGVVLRHGLVSHLPDR